jgi:acetolactate synthase-1/2/3 large subunit
MKVSDYIAAFLVKAGITHVFELSGGMLAHLLDSFSRHPQLSVVSVHHEQAGAFAAEAFGRYARRPAVALGTSGPGALNLVSGIAGCYYDSIPSLFLTGQVQTYLQRGARQVRQYGLQECNFLEVARPIAKAVFAVSRVSDLAAILHEAYVVAVTGRPGPVVIDLPFDIQGSPIDAEVEVPVLPTPDVPRESDLDSVLELLANAHRPLILAGGGIRAAGASTHFLEFVERVGSPVVLTVMALDSLRGGHPLRVGMVGMYGLRAANLAFAESDAVLVLGSRLDQGVTGGDVRSWKRGKAVVQIDCDPAELGARISGATAIQADLRAFLPALVRRCDGRLFPDRTNWLTRIEDIRSKWPHDKELEGCEGIDPNFLISELSAASTAACAFVVDAGQHTWWAAQSLHLAEDQRLLASTGLWAMGTALPAAIGAAFASGLPVVAIAGDGAMQINIQEMETIVRNRLPIKIVVLNNHCHGMVRQFQEEFFEGRYPSTLWGYTAPDFSKIACAYGVPSRSVDRADDLRTALQWLWEDPLEARLLDVHISTYLNVYPHVQFGRPLSAMQSFAGKA